MDIAAFLAKQGCNFERVSHMPARSAQRVAEAIHVPGAEVAKTVLLRADDYSRYYLAVLPANKRIRLDLAGQLVGDTPLHLATESEVHARCPSRERDVLPPFGSRYGIRTIVDSSLAEDEFIYFDATTHDEAIRIRFADYLRVEDPLVGCFADSCAANQQPLQER